MTVIFYIVYSATQRGRGLRSTHGENEMNELKTIDELLEEDRQARIAAYEALPFIGDLIEEDIQKAIESEKHVNEL